MFKELNVFAMRSQILPRRTNAMCIHQVAAEEEFLTDASAADDVRPLEPSMTTDLTQSVPGEADPASTPWESSIQNSLTAVGEGIQALLSESMTAATGEVTNELHTTVQRQVRKAIRQHLPELSRQLQVEANASVTNKAEQVAARVSAETLQGFQSAVDSRFEEMKASVEALTGQLQQLAGDNSRLRKTHEEQRKVIVALVKKVGVLENQATQTVQHQQSIDQRLLALEQPADLDSEWEQLLGQKNDDGNSETAA